MRKIESYEELAPLLAAQLKRGVRTNCFLRRDDLEREISAGTLYAEEWPGGLAILRRRPECDRLSYYITDIARPFPATLERDTVVETAFRERDAAAADETGRFWAAAGFRPLLRRVRLTRAAAPDVPAEDAEAEPARAEDFREVQRLLVECFHPRAGCLPTDGELRSELAEGKILCLRDVNGRVGGILHFSEKPGETEIRHLAVRDDLRRHGMARRLVRGFLALSGGIRSRVWTAEDNAPALALYGSFGYGTDGWRSSVSLFEKGRYVNG